MSNGTNGTKFQPAVSSETTKMNITDSETLTNDNNQMKTTHGNITATNEFCLEELHCDDNQSNNNGKLIKYK